MALITSLGWDTAKPLDLALLRVLVKAIEERELVCHIGRKASDGLGASFENRVALETPVLNVLPVLEDIRQRIYGLAPCFVIRNADAYEASDWKQFPLTFGAIDIDSDVKHRIDVMPGEGVHMAGKEALKAYRQFLANCAYWLGKFRAVKAEHVACRKWLDCRVTMNGDTNWHHVSEWEVEDNSGVTGFNGKIASFSSTSIRHQWEEAVPAGKDEDGNETFVHVVHTEQWQEGRGLGNMWVGNPVSLAAKCICVATGEGAHNLGFGEVGGAVKETDVPANSCAEVYDIPGSLPFYLTEEALAEATLPPREEGDYSASRNARASTTLSCKIVPILDYNDAFEYRGEDFADEKVLHR